LEQDEDECAETGPRSGILAGRLGTILASAVRAGFRLDQRLQNFPRFHLAVARHLWLVGMNLSRAY
jgi:hypothetical protein